MKLVAMATAAATFAAGSLGAAMPARSAEDVVVAPTWVRQPSEDELQASFPPEAKVAEVEGVAVLECSVRADQTLEDCMVISESPERLGFGGAALGLSKVMRMTPKTRNGKPEAGARVRTTVRWTFDGEAHSAAARVIDTEFTTRCYAVSFVAVEENLSIRPETSALPPMDHRYMLGFGYATLIGRSVRGDRGPDVETRLAMALADARSRYQANARSFTEEVAECREGFVTVGLQIMKAEGDASGVVSDRDGPQN